MSTPPESPETQPQLRLTAAGRDPVRLVLSAAPWRAAGYLAMYVLVTGWVLFSVAFTAVATAVTFVVTIAGIPLLTAAAEAMRWCANVERMRLAHVLTGPVEGRYRPVSGGLIAQAGGRWRDPATWRDLAYLVGMWVPLLVLDTVVVTIWLALLSMVTVPLWYWAPTGDGAYGYVAGGHSAHGLAFGYFPHGPYGHGTVGVFIGTLPSALVAAAVCLVLFLLFNYVLVATARAHARVARALLSPPADPLAAVREVLDNPGPLGALRATASIASARASRPG
jgi:Putative sensor